MNSYPTAASLPKIRVIVRKRPLNKRELVKNEQDIIEIKDDKKVIVKEIKIKLDLEKYIEEHPFTFDIAYDETVTNEFIYLQGVRPMIYAAFETKAKVTCFAYGQTGSGKTFTMMGSQQNLIECQSPGLYLFTAYDIFNLLQQPQYSSLRIYVSFYEIYCGKLYDLLSERKQLAVREDGKQNICIVGLIEKEVMNLNELMFLIENGLKGRTVGITGANADSSRSHGVIQINIKEKTGQKHGKITFIDLAGSERATETIDTNKQTKFDGAEINKSLLALKECIRAMDQDKKYTPFRGSKLTMVLKDSFVGNSKTVMIANISPSASSAEHTLNTLRYANRVKELRSKGDNNQKSLDMETAKNLSLKVDPSEYLGALLDPNKERPKPKVPAQSKAQPKKNLRNNNRKTMVNNRSFSNSFDYINNEEDYSFIEKENINAHNNNYMMTDNMNYPKQTLNLRPRLSRGNNTAPSMEVKRKHEEILNTIRQEEDKCIQDHKNHIDEMIEYINIEMNIVGEVQKDHNSMRNYIKTMKEVYDKKMMKMTMMKNQLEHLEQLYNSEGDLSSKLQENGDWYMNDSHNNTFCNTINMPINMYMNMNQNLSYISSAFTDNDHTLQ